MELSATEAEGLAVDDRVCFRILNVSGTVKFLGATSFAEGVWVGLELDQPIGKNDGEVGGKRYFRCAPNRGVFARPVALKKGVGDLRTISVVGPTPVNDDAGAPDPPKAPQERTSPKSGRVRKRSVMVRRSKSANPTEAPEPQALKPEMMSAAPPQRMKFTPPPVEVQQADEEATPEAPGTVSAAAPRRSEEAPVKIVEVIKEVPVEKIVEVEKVVEVIKEVEVIREVPVEKIVEVEKEVVKFLPVEKVVEVPKEVVRSVPVEREVVREVEVVKEVPVEKLVEVEKEVIKEVPVERVVERIVEVEKEVVKEVPVEKIIEVIKEVPVEVIREVPVEKIVHVEVIKEVPVIEIVEKIVEVEKEVVKEAAAPRRPAGWIASAMGDKLSGEEPSEMPSDLISLALAEIVEELREKVEVQYLKEKLSNSQVDKSAVQQIVKRVFADWTARVAKPDEEPKPRRPAEWIASAFGTEISGEDVNLDTY